MTLRQDLFRIARVAAFGAAVNACSHDDSSTVIKPNLPHFNDITTAPSKIQSAARAVVRLHTAGQLGTGSFISPTGLLLTSLLIRECFFNLNPMVPGLKPNLTTKIFFRNVNSGKIRKINHESTNQRFI